MGKMLLCEYCIEEMRSRGEQLLINYDSEITFEDAEEMGITCEWCDETDALYEVFVLD